MIKKAMSWQSPQVLKRFFVILTLYYRTVEQVWYIPNFTQAFRESKNTSQQTLHPNS